MSNLKDFEKFTDVEKKRQLNQLYHNDNKSWEQIATDMGTYPNKIRRLATKLGIKSKTQSEAQVASLATGRREHPTAGKQRTEETKIKISESQAKIWENLTKQERQTRSDTTRKQYNAMTPQQRKNFLNKAAEGLKLASKEGSKLEKYLYAELKSLGWNVQMHREQQFVNEKLHIDLFVPSLNISIEIDGPAHFEAIWGTKTLRQKQNSDRQKNGLILGAGGCLVRVKYSKETSDKRKRDILAAIVDILTSIKDKYPSKNSRYFEIGE